MDRAAPYAVAVTARLFHVKHPVKRRNTVVVSGLSR